MNDGTITGMIHWLLSADPAGGPLYPASYEAVAAAAAGAGAPAAMPIDQAMARGFLSPCVSLAFAAGYQAALRSLIPTLPPEGVVSFCVTEAEGGHPRHVRSTLTPDAGGWRLAGEKRFVTQAADADILAVAASTGRDETTNRLAMVLVPRRAAGVTVTLMPELPFVPEVSHGMVRFDDVVLAGPARLPGDGYTEYVRPFRTHEDLHVTAAVTAHVLAVARRSAWPRDHVEHLVALLALFRALAGEDPRKSAMHVALGGALASVERLLEASAPAWALVGEAERSRWERDRKILGVARSARIKRLETAWSRYEKKD